MLRFRLFDMPVTVRGSFLLIAGLIGFVSIWDPVRGSVSSEGMIVAVAWIAIVFGSILVHELGHAVIARSFGSDVAIELNGLGGLTRWSLPEVSLTPGRRALIAAAGSATGLLFGGIVWLVSEQFGPYTPLVEFLLTILIRVNVFWGLLNWLPIRPLDGGHLLESLLEKVAPSRAGSIAKLIFTGTAAAAAGIALWQGWVFAAVLAGWLLLSELSAGQEPAPRAGLPTLSYDELPEDQAPPVPPRMDNPGEWPQSEEPDEPSESEQ